MHELNFSLPIKYQLRPVLVEAGEPAQNCATQPQLLKLAQKDTMVDGTESC